MAKFIITADTRIKGQPITKGKVIDLDPKSNDDLVTIGLLNHAGRILEATPANVARIQEEIEAEKPKAERPRRSEAPKE